MALLPLGSEAAGELRSPTARQTYCAADIREGASSTRRIRNNQRQVALGTQEGADLGNEREPVSILELAIDDDIALESRSQDARQVGVSVPGSTAAAVVTAAGAAVPKKLKVQVPVWVDVPY